MKCLSVLLAFVLVASLVPSQAVAQRGGANVTEKPGGPRKQIATIVLTGIAGAVLGLSTLSFYGRPQEKLSNIAVGFAIGIIGGAVYTTYKAASQPRNFYNGQLLDEQDALKNLRNFQASQPPKVGYTFTF